MLRPTSRHAEVVIGKRCSADCVQRCSLKTTQLLLTYASDNVVPKLMIRPVTAADGYTYEKQAIVSWV